MKRKNYGLAEVSRACKRGLGPPARAAPFPLLEVGAAVARDVRLKSPSLSPDAPKHPFACSVLATWRLRREVEVANCALDDIKLDSNLKTLSITVSASKADVTALGATVTLCCVCHCQLQSICPYCIGRVHLKARMSELSITSRDQMIDKPLFPSGTGAWPTKAGVVEAITALASATGLAPSTRRGALK